MITKYDEYIKESLSNKNNIKNWLDEMDIEYYTINDDLTVDVDGEINIIGRNLTKIPVKFNKVNGQFDCSINNLTSLEGCPNMVDGYFICTFNDLTNLKYCPTIINGDFYCSYNQITSLYGCPNIINGDFYCSDNPYLVDINHLDSKILIKSINKIKVTQKVFDKYFEYWIDKDFNIFEVLKDKVSDTIKQKYSHLFQANNFDLI